MEVWQTSNLRRLRLGEEKKKKEEERGRNHRMKIYMVSLFHRATIKEETGQNYRMWASEEKKEERGRKKKKPQDDNIMVCPIP